MSAFPITYCKPGIAQGATFRDDCVSYREKKPVHMPEPGCDGLSFSDFNRMQTMTRTVGTKHRREIPIWALNDKATRAVVLTYMEGRVRRGGRILSVTSTERERIITVMAGMKARAASLDALAGHLCDEYVAHLECTSPFCINRRKVLASMVEGVDKQICFTARPDIFFEIARAYYRQRMNATEVANFVGGVTPPGVRQILFRLNKTAASLGYPVTFQKKLTAEERAARKLRREAAATERRAMQEEVTERRRQLAERAKLAPKVPRVHHGGRKGWRKHEDGLTTRQRWERDGKCQQCGKAKEQETKSRCDACLQKMAGYAAARKVRAAMKKPTA